MIRKSDEASSLLLSAKMSWQKTKNTLIYLYFNQDEKEQFKCVKQTYITDCFSYKISSKYACEKASVREEEAGWVPG